MSNGKSIHKKSSKPGSRTATSTTHPSLPIYVPSTAHSTVAKWISSLPDSLASPIVSQDNGREEKTSGTSGLIPRESSMRWDRDMSCWRTSQASFLEMQDGQPMGARLSESFPSWGTTVNGELWEQEMPVHPTSESDGGALGWPTPTHMADSFYVDNSPNKEKRHSRGLASEVEYMVSSWPTPSSLPRGPYTGRESHNMQTISKTTGTKFGMTLETATYQWATPQSRDYRSTEVNKPRWENPDRSRNLNDQVAFEVRTWPTPNVVDYKGFDPPGKKNPHRPGELYEVGMWNTPNTMDTLPAKTQEALDHEYTHRQGRSNPNNLRDQVNVEEGQAKWPGPQAHQTETVGPESSPSDQNSLPPSPKRLNPNFVEWLMGLPIGWTDLKPLETESYHQWYENFSEGL